MPTKTKTKHKLMPEKVYPDLKNGSECLKCIEQNTTKFEAGEINETTYTERRKYLLKCLHKFNPELFGSENESEHTHQSSSEKEHNYEKTTDKLIFLLVENEIEKQRVSTNFFKIGGFVAVFLVIVGVAMCYTISPLAGLPLIIAPLVIWGLLSAQQLSVEGGGIKIEGKGNTESIGELIKELKKTSQNEK